MELKKVLKEEEKKLGDRTREASKGGQCLPVSFLDSTESRTCLPLCQSPCWESTQQNEQEMKWA